MMLKTIVLFLCVCLPLRLLADVVYLNDGKLLRGKLTSSDDRHFIIETETGWTEISKDEIKGIKIGDKYFPKPQSSETCTEETNKAGDAGSNEIPQVSRKTEEISSIVRTEDEYSQGKTRGADLARQLHTGSGWFAGGLGSGLLLGLIGTGIITAISSGSSPEPPSEYYFDKSNDYRLGLKEGYLKKARGSNVLNALLGGVFGTGIITLILLGGQK